MKAFSKFILFILCISLSSNTLFPQERNAQVTGRVTDENMHPLSQVHIKIKDTDLGTQTDVQGEYAIDAYPGDILLFSHLAMEPVEIRVKRSSFVINVQMTSTSMELEEVEITKKTTREFMTQKEMLRAYPEDKSLIKTAYGIINSDIASGWMRIIDGEDLFPGVPATEALQAHFPQRDFHNIWFDVDGFLFDEEPLHIYSNDIDRIAVLGGYESTKRYGSRSPGMVVVINTKAQTWQDDMRVDRSEEHQQLLDSAMRVTHLDPYSPYVPPYLEKLQKVRSEKKALAIVEDQQNSHLSDPCYFLEVYELFLSRWGNNEKPKELSEYIIENFSEDISVLKALAFIKQHHGCYLDALYLYTEILKSQSWHAQPLRDVANAYAETGDNKKAWMYYTQYISILAQMPKVSFDPYGEDQLIATEMMNILEQNNEVSFDRDTILTGMYDSDPQTRLVFEWNNPEAVFELQFVTPEGYYDTWSNKQSMNESQNPVAVNGYTSHQFFLGKENIGLWQIDIDYKGNNSEMPTYLKVSVYHDYGLPGQQSEINIYKLSKNEKAQLFTLKQN